MELSTVRDESLSQALEKVYEMLSDTISAPAGNGRIAKVLEHAASRGKLLRPRLLLISAMFGESYGKNLHLLINAASALEISHMASLIHDDIIDDSPLRRGKATVQGKYGKDVAVYTGDLLLARAARLLSAEDFRCLAESYSDALEQLCIGEIMQDISRYDPNISKAQYLENIRGKTAVLFKLACGTGARLSGCSDEQIEELEHFGEILGMLFQIRDDMLDISADSKQMGKETMVDFAEGIYTLPVFMALENPDVAPRLREIIALNAQGAIERSVIDEAFELINSSGATEKCRREINAYAEKLLAIVCKLPECPASTMLSEMVEALANV